MLELQTRFYEASGGTSAYIEVANTGDTALVEVHKDSFTLSISTPLGAQEAWKVTAPFLGEVAGDAPAVLSKGTGSEGTIEEVAASEVFERLSDEEDFSFVR